jgi:heme-degrading monooxygenase HmoA
VHALLSRLELPAERLEDLRRAIGATLLPALCGMPGFRSAYWLLGREPDGSIMVLSLWDSEAVLEANEAGIEAVRRLARRDLELHLLSACTYSVVAQS